MISVKQPKKLKSRLILYFSIITIVPSMFISIFYYRYSTNLLKTTMIKDAEANEVYIMDNIDNQLKIVENLSDWMVLNRSLEKVLIDNNLEKANFDNELIDAHQNLENVVMDSSVSKNISAIIISGMNRVNLRYGDDASLIDIYQFEKQQWFKEGISKNGAKYFLGIFKNPSTYTNDEYVIPIVRPIIYSTLQTHIGWSYIGLKESLISDVYKKFYKQNQNPIYIVDSKGICVSSSDVKYIGKSIENKDFIKKALESKQSYFDSKEENVLNLIVYSKSNLTGWTLIEKISYEPLYEQKAMLLRMSSAILLGSILIASIFTMFISSNLTGPLRNILKRMREISDGNFETDPSLEGNDEMGQLGKGINELASNVNKLLKKVKEEETTKRNLELMVLQNQVNPHFLYNTLNSIKWMAMVQKADGIKDIVSALGRLLMNISKEKSEEISIRRELSLTEDYILIQNMRYSGKIKVQLIKPDDKLLDNNILKFTLQPIIENAIFHGIEPKKEAGNIKINIKEDAEDIIINIEDDGIGMESETIKRIFDMDRKHENRGFRSIGIKNVHDRLKLFYGENYGLNIESILGIYTKVSIKIPKTIKLYKKIID